jgi:hypothetical protein
VRYLFRLRLGDRINNPDFCRVTARAAFTAEGIERKKLTYGQERFDAETTPEAKSIVLRQFTVCLSGRYSAYGAGRWASGTGRLWEVMRGIHGDGYD